MVETRRAPRYRVSKAGTIDFGGRAIDCTVRDLSRTGAAIEIPNQIGIPQKFTLALQGDRLHLPCPVVWRRGYRIGATFD